LEGVGRRGKVGEGGKRRVDAYARLVTKVSRRALEREDGEGGDGRISDSLSGRSKGGSLHGARKRERHPCSEGGGSGAKRRGMGSGGREGGGRRREQVH
jgi:hypothetical protein